MCVQIVLDANLLHSVWIPWNHCMYFHLSKGIISLPSYLSEIVVLFLNFKSQLTTSLEIPIVGPYFSWYSGLLQIQLSPTRSECASLSSVLTALLWTLRSGPEYLPSLGMLCACLAGWPSYYRSCWGCSVWSYFKSRIKFH